MGKIKKIGYTLNEIGIIQAPISYQNHRGDVNPYICTCNKEMLPIFVAPMESVTDENNYKIWIDNKLCPVIPRSVMQRLSVNDRVKLAKDTFVSFSLQEVVDLYEFNVFDLFLENDKNAIHICIDIAHGTLSNLYDICKKIKDKYGDGVIIMTGNINTPKAYKLYCQAGIDYVRASIGSGSRCTTACAPGVYSPMATLLDDLYDEKKTIIKYNELAIKKNEPTLKITKIIADGGIGWYSDIQKSLVLGADAVMIGRLFAECEESCGEWHWAFSEEDAESNNWLTTDERDRWISDWNYQVNHGGASLGYEDNPFNLKPFRMYRGMSHRSSQKITGGTGNKVSEGICKHVSIKYPVKHFLMNVEAYLRSCMTYINASNIDEMKNADVIIINDGGLAIKK